MVQYVVLKALTNFKSNFKEEGLLIYRRGVCVLIFYKTVKRLI